MTEKEEVWYIGYMRTGPDKKTVFVEQKAEATTYMEAGRERDKLRMELETDPEAGFTYSDFGLRMES